ncbi:HNH endonuclease signature motif containing protein [Sanguibacter keddieii]|uniref:HNH endonuclease signature motif containing protein n=1 Tax=Sanguibacter keddieii TaxID=60920 RepID=UPI001C27ACF4|nr:HNH endonuclease signature motif containing protein [Sanguibacter keddieii]
MDELEAAERAIASAHARRIRAIEAVRVLAVETVRGLDPTLGPVDPADAVRVREIRRQQALARRAAHAEVACVLRTPEMTTTSLVHEAQVLVDHHPATLAALTRGEISRTHARVVLENTAALEPDECRDLEVTLVERAKDSTVAALRRYARRQRERSHPRPLVERHRERLAERRVEIEPARDGMMWLHQYLPAVQATAIYNRLTDVAVTFQGKDEQGMSEDRTLAQLRVDVFSALLLDDDAARLVHGDTGPGLSAEPGPGAAAKAPGAAAKAPGAAAEAPGAAAEAPSASEAAPSPGEVDRGVGEVARGAGEVAPSAGGVAPSRAGALTGRGEPASSTAGSVPSGARTAPSPPGVAPSVTDGVIGGRHRAVGPSLRGVQPTVAVTVPVMTLLGHGDEPGHLEGYGPVDADTAREIAARAASFTRILTHPETAVVLSVGRQKYAVPADLKAWLRLRDETCRFPGCGRRAARCDIDHVAPWQLGGGTDHDNLIHLCRHHHRLKHETGWSVASATSGGETTGVFARPEAVTWTSPAGRRYVDHPALPRPAHDLPRHPTGLVDLGERRSGPSGGVAAGDDAAGGIDGAKSSSSSDEENAEAPGLTPDPFPDEPPF